MNTADKIDEQLSDPRLVLIRGLPGSGKSYLAAALQTSIGEGQTVLLDPDATDYESKAYKDFSAALTEEGVELKFHPYRFLRAKAHQAIAAHKIIIWNQAFTLLAGFQRTVDNLQEFATTCGTTLPVLVVEVEIDLETAKQRVGKRESEGGHGVSDEAFDRFINDYKSFADQGYNTIAVHGDDDVAASASAVMQALKAL